MKIWRAMPSLFAVCVLASCDTVSTSKLRGIWPTCLESWEIEKADAAARRADFAAILTTSCGLFGDSGKRVRVIRCATDVTPARMKRFSDPVPSDDSLLDQICEVEVFQDDGSSGFYYTYYFNIYKSP